MGVPGFLLRKLYKRGSLRPLGDDGFAFTMQNPLASTTLLSPPSITVNGVNHPPESIDAGAVEMHRISESHPFVFKRGAEIELHLKGHLMKANRIHIQVQTKEYDDIDFLVEDYVRPTGDEEE